MPARGHPGVGSLKDDRILGDDCTFSLIRVLFLPSIPLHLSLTFHRYTLPIENHPLTMESFQPGDRVFAKVRGYPPWPARVDGTMEVQGKTRFHVFFYGTYEV